MASRASSKVEAHVGTPASDQLFVLFDELWRSRDRLAGLPPLTRNDIEAVSRAMHEVAWYFLTPPKGATTELALPDRTKADLLRSAGDRSADLYTMAVACVALKLSASPRVPSPAALFDALTEFLDSLAFDFRMPKKNVLALLSRARKEIDARAAYLRASRPTRPRFGSPSQLYRNRPDKTEKPDAFFRRVYGAEVRRGLTQADLRRADAAFYNVLHVWCTRHKKRMSALVPASRPRGHQ